MTLIPSFLSNELIVGSDPTSSEGIYGTDFNGVYMFDNYTLGSDPWVYEGTPGSAQIIHSSYGHSYVYELYAADRMISVTNDMSSDFKIESYVNLASLSPSGTGAIIFQLRGLNSKLIRWGYNKDLNGWFRATSTSGNILILSGENWSSNSWMYWRIEFTASSDTYKFYINNSLLDTVIYNEIDVLKRMMFSCGSWGDAGPMRIDSFSYSWHPDYYEGMIFDVYTEDTDGDGMPDDWETENGLDPDDDTDALIDSDTDGLLNLYEYGNSTDPQDADSDNDLLNDGPEVKTYLTDPNDPDSDNDLLNDGAEVNTHATNPNDADTDNDLLNDGAEVNTYSTNPNDPDSDNDLLNDGEEVNTYSTNPNDADSDDDTYNDNVEVDAGKDPNNPYSYPGFEYYGFKTSTVPSAWNVYSDTGVLQVGELASGVSGEGRNYLRWTVSGYWDRLKISSISSTAAEVDFWINIHTYGNSGTYPERGLTFGVWNSAYSYAVNTISWGYNGLYRMVAGVGAKIADYSINTWYHVRFTWNCSAGFSEIYINGDFITSWSISTYASYSQVTFLNSMNVQPRYVDIDEFYSDNKNVDLDNDGMPSYYEVENGLDPVDDSDNVTDLDSDFLLNIYEFGNLTDPNDSDTDDDLLEDGEEVLTYFTNPNDVDSDDDTLTDYAELIMYNTDPNDPDSDGDTLTDVAEINIHNTDPNDADSDDDTLNDYAEVITYGSDPNDPDSDDDTLNDYGEVITYGSDPNDPDSDDDTLTDAAEINIHNTDPNDVDSDDDLLNDNVEINIYSTDPNDPDSDGDGFTDKQELDAEKDPNNPSSYPGMFEPERFAVFMIFIMLAAIVSVSGVFITKNQHKRRFMR